MGCLALTRHIIISGQTKMRVGQGRESNFASGCGALRTYFCLLAMPKYDFSEVEKAMIQGNDWNYLGLIHFMAYQKCELGDVEKSKFQVVG